MSIDSQLSCGIVNTGAVLVNTFHLLRHSISIDLVPPFTDLQAKHNPNFSLATKYARGCYFYLHFAQENCLYL